MFTAPAAGEPPDPGGAVVHRIEPLLAIGNAPLIPSLARIEGFDLLHLHYPFIFGSELTLLGRLARKRRRQALLVHYKNRLVGQGARAGCCSRPTSTPSAPLLVRAADRVCVLSPDHAGSVPYLRRHGRARPREAGRDAERRRHGAVRTAGGRSGAASLARHPGRGAGGGLRRHARPRPPLQAARPGDRGDRAGRGGDGHRPSGTTCVVAGGGELLDGFRDQARAAGVGERVHFLGAGPPRRAARRAPEPPISSCSPPSRRSRSGSS